MRRVRILEHVSLDGVIQNGRDQDGDFHYGDWTAPYRSPEGAQAVSQAQGSHVDFVLGRRTYDLWSAFWPTVKGGPFGDKMNAATKYVATHRPEGLEWGPAERLSGDIAEAVRRLKSTDGPDLIVSGSSTLTSPLLDAGLVDEVVLMVYPVLIGRGKRIFADRDGRELAFVGTQATPTGVLINTYRHVGALRTAHQGT